MEYSEADWRVSAHFEDECGEPHGEIPFEGNKSCAWEDKMRGLDAIRREIEPQLAAKREALDETFGLESGWHDQQERGGYEEYHQAKVH